MAKAGETNGATRVAVVTGASRGIGRAISLRLAAEGRHVVLVSRSEGPLSEVKSLIEEAGGEASLAAVDVGDAAALRATMDSVIEELGRVDIVVNNAGVTRDNLSLRMTDDEFMDVIRVNLLAAFVTSRAGGPADDASAVRPDREHRGRRPAWSATRARRTTPPRRRA